MSPTPSPVSRVLLVHGSWADGSCWQRVISELQALGHDPVAVQLPLTAFEDDVATLVRCLERSNLPTVLVGHSYGGAVISAVDVADHPVKALVYAAASAPDIGETMGSVMTMNDARVTVAMDVDAGGYAWAAGLDSFHEAFGSELPRDFAATLFAVQKPLNISLVGASPAHAAWRHVSSHYLVADDDALFSPDTQIFLAERMKAHIKHAPSGHMLPITQPDAIIEMILAALAD
jgi:pimeloyl-ACP methyl ester carboxylesterase